MKLKRSEHSRFVQWLDRTAEKNPLLWLPCVLLIALMLTAEHIAEYAKIARLHRKTEKIVKDRPRIERKPFALRAVAVTVTAAFGLMLVPVTSFADFDEEYDSITEQVAFGEESETEETSDSEETTESEVTTAPESEEPPVTEEITSSPEETADPEDTSESEETSDPDETTSPAETTAPEETTAPDETTDPEETDPIESSVHNFNGSWKSDADSHWHVCENYGCNEVGDLAGHTFDGWESDENGHYQECYICGFKTDIEGHDYEWDFYTSDQHCRSCSVCGEVTDIGEHSVDKWGYDDNGHFGMCVCGERLSSEAHHFSEYVFTLDDGTVYDPDDEDSNDDRIPVKRYYCTSYCGYYYDEPIDHTHTLEDGWASDISGHWHVCTFCDKHVDTASHSYNIKVTLEPTDTTKGTRVYTCTVCGYSYDETIPELGHVHEFGAGWNKNDTAHWHECVCGEKTDIASHVSDGGRVTVQPTSASAGVRSYTCTTCGYIIKTESIPALSDMPNVPDTGYYPSAAVTEASQRVPYITNSPEIKGWLDIAAYINASADEAIIPITMNGENEMPKEIAECIMNRNVTLTINMGGGSVWTVNGLDVISPRTVNMRVSEQSNKIPSKVIDNLISEFEPKEYRLYHSGDFGFTAELTLNVGNRYDNYYAVLYHYNGGTKQLEFVDESLVENRYVTFSITHASYYAVAFNSISMYDDVSASAGVFESSIPLETSAMPETNGVQIPAVKLPQIMRYSNKKRRYRILRKRRLDDLVFVL